MIPETLINILINFSSNQNDNIILIAENGQIALFGFTTNGLNNYNLKTKSIKDFIRIILESISSNFIYDLYSFDSLLFVGTDQGLSTINTNNNSINEIDFLKILRFKYFRNKWKLMFSHLKRIYKLKNLFTTHLKKYIGKQLNLKVINNNEFVVWNTLSKIDRIFYYNDKFQTQLLSNGSSQKINDINNFKGAYYISTMKE